MGISLWEALIFLFLSTPVIGYLHYIIAKKKNLPPQSTTIVGVLSWFFIFPVGFFYFLYAVIRKPVEAIG